MPAAAELLEDEANDFGILGIRDDVAKIAVVNVANGPIARPAAGEQFFTDATHHIALVVDNEIGCAATLNRDEKSGICRPILAGRRADGCYNFALQHPAHAALVCRIAIQAVYIPDKNPVSFASLNAPKHRVEDRAPRGFGRPALLKNRDNLEPVAFYEFA